jgi:hypothetical protein
MPVAQPRLRVSLSAESSGSAPTATYFTPTFTTDRHWSGWTEIGGLGVGSPACAALGTGQVVCVVMGPDNKLTSVVGP